MQTSTQSYGTHIYSQVQNGSLFTKEAGQKSSFGQSATPSDPSRSQQSDSVSLSPAGRERSQTTTQAPANAQKGVDQKSLSMEELKILSELKARDTEVRAHEQAHLSSAGQYAAGGASFSYTAGPNGKRYATGGEVPIDMSKADSPAATISKMRTVRRAALAPANPSAADRSIAASASAKEAQARKELQEEAKQTAETTLGNLSVDQGTKPNAQDKSTNDTPRSSEISDYNRSVMKSAYETMAALAA
jgi:ribosomal protein S30